MLFAGLFGREPFPLLSAGKLCSLVDGVREQLMRLHDVGHEAGVGDNIVQRGLEVLHAVLVPRAVSSDSYSLGSRPMSWTQLALAPAACGAAGTSEVTRKKQTCTLLQSMSGGLLIASSTPA